MTVSEAVGKVAEAFRNGPGCLAAILLAALFAVLTFYAMQKDADRRARTVDLLLERCYPEHLPGDRR